MTTLLALAVLALAAAIWLCWMNRPLPETDAPAARAAPRDPVAETVDKWMHDWMRGRA